MPPGSRASLASPGTASRPRTVRLAAESCQPLRHLLDERQQLEDGHVGRACKRSRVDEHRQLRVRVVGQQVEEKLSEGHDVFVGRAKLEIDHAAHLAHNARAIARVAGVHPRKRWKPGADEGCIVPERKVRCTPRKVISQHR
eukprot:scaffold75792_cov65-Phaeocystis_antarctica.AAC.7